MKKNVVILMALAVGIALTAYGYETWNDNNEKDAPSCKRVHKHSLRPSASIKKSFEFAYTVEARFMNTVTKEMIDKASSLTDIVPTDGVSNVVSFHNINLSTFHEDRINEIQAKNDNELFTNSQIAILRSMDYSSSFYMTGSVIKKDKEGYLKYDTLIYYMSVVPEKPATYTEGHDALIDYLKEGSQKEVAKAEVDKLQPGKISFVVSKNGTVKDAKITFSSGYRSIDKKMLELIENIPSNWEPASNAKGEKVEQELTFFFGLIGC